MTTSELWIGIYVLGLAGVLAAMLLASRTTNILARDLRLPRALSILMRAPFAELSMVFFGVTFYSWSLALGLVTGTSLSNMIVASAMAIERARTIGFETFPMYIAACLSLVPVGFGIWTASTTHKVAIGLIIYAIHLQLLFTYTIAVPLWRTRKDGYSPRTTDVETLQETAASVDAENCTTPVHPEDTVNVAPAGLGQLTDSRQGTTSTVDNLETEPLMPPRPDPDPTTPDAWQIWTRYLFTLAFLILCSAIASFVIHKLAERLNIADKHPAILFGLLLATCPSLLTIRTLMFGDPSAENISEVKIRCSNNLVLLAAGLLIVGIDFDRRRPFEAVPLLFPPMLAALFAVLGFHLRGYWWLIGVLFLVMSFISLAFYTFLVLAFGRSRDPDPWMTANNW